MLKKMAAVLLMLFVITQTLSCEGVDEAVETIGNDIIDAVTSTIVDDVNSLIDETLSPVVNSVDDILFWVSIMNKIANNDETVWNDFAVILFDSLNASGSSFENMKLAGKENIIGKWKRDTFSWLWESEEEGIEFFSDGTYLASNSKIEYKWFYIEDGRFKFTSPGGEAIIVNIYIFNESLIIEGNGEYSILAKAK